MILAPRPLFLSLAAAMSLSTPALAEGLVLEGSLTVVSQTVDQSAGANDSQLTNRVDVTAEMPAGKIGTAEGKLFAHIRAGNEAAAGNDAYATSNATAFDVPGAVLLQGWYQLDIPVGGEGNKAELTLGKIDPFGFFDGNALSDDETEGFLNLAFVHNPLLDVGGDVEPGAHGASPGVRLAYGSLNASAGGSEKITELFYAAEVVAKPVKLQITPSIQKVQDARGVAGADRTVYGVRAKAAF